MRYLVTGATGFVGAGMTHALAAQRKQVRVLVREASDLTPLSTLDLELVRGDLRDESSLAHALASVEVVFHCAGLVSEWRPHKVFRETNAHGTANLLRVSRDLGVRRVVAISSLSVYGIKNHEGTREDAPFEKSGDGYSDSKIDAEEVMAGFLSSGRPELCVLRPGFIYGPGDRRFVPRLVESLRSGRFAFIGDGNNVLNIVYIDDVVQAALLAAAVPGAAGRAYNLTDGTRTTAREFIGEIAALSGLPAPNKHVPYALANAIVKIGEMRARLFGGQPRVPRAALKVLATSRYFDITRARQELGYKPEVRFQEGLRRTLGALQEAAAS
jgi:nucleoside-diphosphate-sugar epimerase